MRESEKEEEEEEEEGQTSKATGKKNRGENASFFLFLLLLRCVPPSLSLLCSEISEKWSKGEEKRNRRDKKRTSVRERERERGRQMIELYPRTLNSRIATRLDSLPLSLCHHLLGIELNTNVVNATKSRRHG